METKYYVSNYQNSKAFIKIQEGKEPLLVNKCGKFICPDPRRDMDYRKASRFDAESRYPEIIEFPKYFVHLNGFESCAYIQINSFDNLILSEVILKNGGRKKAEPYDYRYASSAVEKGVWEEISENEAKKLIKIEKYFIGDFEGYVVARENDGDWFKDDLNKPFNKDKTGYGLSLSDSLLMGRKEVSEEEAKNHLKEQIKNRE